MFAALPLFASAEGSSALESLVTYSDVFAALSLWSTLIIAFVTTVLVWMGGRHMRGGIMGSLLNYFSIGMTLLFAAFVAGSPLCASLYDAATLSIIHNVLYTIGYILMGVAASKLLQIIKG